MNFVSGQLLSGATRSIANSKDFCASSPHVSEVSYSEHELDITRCPFQEEEDACRLAEDNAAERLEQERLTVEAEAERLEQEKMAVAAAARQAEVEILVNQAELDRLEQERIERERALTEQRQAAMAVSVAVHRGNTGLGDTEEGIVEHSASAVVRLCFLKVSSKV